MESWRDAVLHHELGAKAGLVTMVDKDKVSEGIEWWQLILAVVVFVVSRVMSVKFLARPTILTL